MSDVVLYIILSIFSYGEKEPSIIEVKLPQESMIECERTLEDMEIVEGPELQIFGTKLDIEAYCFSVNAIVNNILRNEDV